MEAPGGNAADSNVVSAPFAIIVPGRPVQNTFAQRDADKWTCDLPQANAVSSLTVFLTQPIQDGNYGLAVYISPPPYAEGIYLGAVTNQSPSNTLRLRWPPPLSTQAFDAKLGMTLEPVAELVKKRSPIPVEAEEYQIFAKFVAADLFRFMESFNKHTDEKNEFLLIPTKVLDMWFEKFMNRMKLDPFFWYKHREV
ncbi:DUF775 domain-containing protein [Balamuthia mandrillaris]